MKKGKNPTRRQKIAIKSHGLNPGNWLVYKRDPADEHFFIVHRETENTRKIIY